MITSLKISLIAFASASVERPIANDDAAKRRLLIGGERFLPRFAQIGIAPDAARIGVLQNRDRRLGKFRDQIGRRGDVENVVKGKFLAVKFFEVLVESRRKAPRSDADFRRSATVSPAAARAKTRCRFPVPDSGNSRSRDRNRKS